MSSSNVTDGKKRRGAGCLRWLGRISLGVLVLLVGLVVAGVIYQAVASARDARLYKPVDQMVEVNGIQMRLDCRGSGSPTVVLEAGGQSSAIFWVRVQDEVAKFTRVCSYDRAGYGWSDTLRETLYPQQVAEMLHTLLVNGGEQPPYLMVGHSFGGVYIRTFTEDYPDEVVGMVLVDSSHDDQNRRTPPELAEAPETVQAKKAFPTMVRIYNIAERIGLLRAFKLIEPGIASYKMADEDKKLLRAQMYRTGFFGAWARETEMMDAYAGQPPKLGGMPLIVLSQKMDAQDTIDQFPPRLQTMALAQQVVDSYNGMQDELAALSTRGKRIVVQDSGHFIQLDQPQAVIDAIREVFEQAAR